jgi:hypothetical protein
MLSARTAKVEEHTTFIGIEVFVNDYADPYAPVEQFFVVHIDRITGDATVYHQGRLASTRHSLAQNVTPSDAHAFALCAVLSLAFNIAG